MKISLIFFLHLFSTFFMTGVIWIIQKVHYPSFLYVDKGNFNAFNIFHQSSITYIVMPVMLIEILTGGLLIFILQDNKTYMILFAITVFIWLSTFFLSVPLHNQLLNTSSEDVIKSLVFTNWPRTILWSIKSIILIYILINMKENLIN